MAKKLEKKEDVMLCTGVNLSNSFFEQKENRLFTILLKGFIVYLISMGSIGFYLSALKIDGTKYNELFCHIAIFIMAMICALLYYRLLVENLGYLLLLAVFALMVYKFKIIINSGFYAIVNITVEDASTFFDQSFKKLYTEQIEDRYLTITFVVLFIGIVLDILLNVYISRRMQYFTAIFIVMGLNMIPLYLTEEPDNKYVIMFLVGIAMAYIYKSGRHYGSQVSTKRNDFIFENKKKELSYKFDVKAMLQAAIFALVFVVLSVNIITAFKPKENFNTGYKTNKYKELTMVAVSTFMLEGWSGFFRRSNDVGGLNGGQLGTVASIKLDHQTDLTIQYTPYSFETLYLKSYVAETYNAYANRWTKTKAVVGDVFDITPESEALKQDFVLSGEYAGRGIIKIRLVDASVKPLVPYYSGRLQDDISEEDARYSDDYSIEYFPRFEGSTVMAKPEDYKNETPYTALDCSVPMENYPVIMDIIQEIGIPENATLDEKIECVKEYFQDNYPYTVKPGRTPKNEDFVNYFLTENKKGYCSHYASASALIFRCLGIPTRYVEGYAIDYYQMTNGEIVSNKFYDDYYEGYSELGKTALVDVEVTDADAHAWIEVYDENFGWRVVDVTPSSDGDEENEDFWDAFDKFVDENPDSFLSGGNNGNMLSNIRISNSLIKKLCYGFVALIAVVIAGFIIWRIGIFVIFVVNYNRATINDKLIMKYSAKCKRLRRFNKEFAGKYNYRDQVEYFGYGNDNIIDILEKAGFSNKEISMEEYETVIQWIKGLSVIKKREEQIDAGE